MHINLVASSSRTPSPHGAQSVGWCNLLCHPEGGVRKLDPDDVILVHWDCSLAGCKNTERLGKMTQKCRDKWLRPQVSRFAVHGAANSELVGFSSSALALTPNPLDTLQHRIILEDRAFPLTVHTIAKLTYCTALCHWGNLKCEGFSVVELRRRHAEETLCKWLQQSARVFVVCTWVLYFCVWKAVACLFRHDIVSFDLASHHFRAVRHHSRSSERDLEHLAWKCMTSSRWRCYA